MTYENTVFNISLRRKKNIIINTLKINKEIQIHEHTTNKRSTKHGGLSKTNLRYYWTELS